MLQYTMKTNEELIAKHCPRCNSLVMASVVRTLNGERYKYSDLHCSSCQWKSPLSQIKNS
ncbi:MAG: hypothetical protein ACOCWZ_11140 [Spirochaetota bacterium]